jgi:hypothetical protein
MLKKYFHPRPAKPVSVAARSRPVLLFLPTTQNVLNSEDHAIAPTQLPQHNCPNTIAQGILNSEQRSNVKCKFSPAYRFFKPPYKLVRVLHNVDHNVCLQCTSSTVCFNTSSKNMKKNFAS